MPMARGSIALPSWCKAAGGRQAGAEAVTALAHQFAGLISPLHGSFSADNLSVKLTICLIPTICLILRLSPVMLTDPKRAASGPKMSRPRSNRAIADSWRGLYGSGRFPSIFRDAAFTVLRNGTIRANIVGLAVFLSARVASRRRAGNRQNRSKTLSICNLTGSRARRILKT